MNSDAKQPSNADNEKVATPRGRSQIEFPYGDLDDALSIAQTVHAVGGTDCSWDQLAAKLNQAPQGGGFRLRVMAARTFGLISYERAHVQLEPLGQRAIDPHTARAAKAEAFLKVPLFRAAYDKFRNAPLPPPAAIERQFEQLGVAPKQKDKARQVFMRSAKSAGYFELAPDRLVAPALKDQPAPPADDEGLRQRGGGNSGSGGSGGSGGGDEPTRHPFIDGLLKTMPATETKWAIADRVKWLQTAANIFDLIYSGRENDDGEIKVSAKKDGGP